MFSTVLPTLSGELDGLQQQHWVATAYVLAGAVTMPLYGQLSDLFGRRGVFSIALLIFLAGSCLGGLAWNMQALIAARALQGLGGGGLLILSRRWSQISCLRVSGQLISVRSERCSCLQRWPGPWSAAG